MQRENFNRAKEIMESIESTENILVGFENRPYGQIKVLVKQGDSTSDTTKLPLEWSQEQRNNPFLKAADNYVETLKVICRDELVKLKEELDKL